MQLVTPGAAVVVAVEKGCSEEPVELPTKDGQVGQERAGQLVIECGKLAYQTEVNMDGQPKQIPNWETSSDEDSLTSRSFVNYEMGDVDAELKGFIFLLFSLSTFNTKVNFFPLT